MLMEGHGLRELTNVVLIEAHAPSARAAGGADSPGCRLNRRSDAMLSPRHRLRMRRTTSGASSLAAAIRSLARSQALGLAVDSARYGHRLADPFWAVCGGSRVTRSNRPAGGTPYGITSGRWLCRSLRAPADPSGRTPGSRSAGRVRESRRVRVDRSGGNRSAALHVHSSGHVLVRFRDEGREQTRSHHT